MARRRRVQLPNLIRHVMARGNGKMAIFLDDTDYRQFTFLLGEVLEQFDIVCWNYCVMPNHYHATVQPRQANISRAFQKLHGDYAQWWNRRHGRVGHTLQGRFKDQIVQNEMYLLALTRYVALNPVRAELVKHAQDWRWASYGAIAGVSTAPSFLDVRLTLALFGEQSVPVLQHRFAEFVNGGDAAPETDDRFRSNEWIVGSAQFKEDVNALVTGKCATLADAHLGPEFTSGAVSAPESAAATQVVV